MTVSVLISDISWCGGGFFDERLHTQGSRCHVVVDHRTRAEDRIMLERRCDCKAAAMDDGSRREGEREGETGSMSDCCSRGWAGLTGCHSHRDTMPQPQRGGGAVCAAAQG